MRPKGSAEALEMRRMMAARVLQQGKGIREVSRLVGVSPGTVSRWNQKLQEQGPEALKAEPHPGKLPKLTAAQKERLAEILRQGARAAGFPTELWMLKRVAQVIEREFGVQHHPGWVGYILREMGWSPQKPERRAQERDEQAIQTWCTEEWEQVKKSQENGWPIVFIDESGYVLQPLVRRAWAPEGETPIQYSWARHGRWSVIAGMVSSPVRRHPRLFFQIPSKNICAEQVVSFLTELHRQVRWKVLMVLDRYSAHRKAIRLLQEPHPDWLEAVWLPAYAPDLNPVEMVWNHTRYGDLANY